MLIQPRARAAPTQQVHGRAVPTLRDRSSFLASRTFRYEDAA